MTAPIALRDVAAAAGMLLVLGTVVSVVGTVIVPRKSGTRLTRPVGQCRECDLRADRPACGQLPVARPDQGGSGSSHPARSAGGLAGVLLCRLRAADLANDPQHRHRVQVGRAGAVDLRLSPYTWVFRDCGPRHGRDGWPGHSHAADRLPSGTVRSLQPA